MTAATPSTPDHASPGAVPRPTAKPIVWWVAGGLGLLGAGALAAALVAGPRHDTSPTAAPETETVGKAVPAAKTPKPATGHSTTTAKSSNTTTAAAPVCAACGTVESV